MILWLVLGGMTAVAVGLLLRPLLQPTTQSDTSTEQDIAVYRAQLRELNHDLNLGLVDADDVQAARTEIERRIIAAKESEAMTEDKNNDKPENAPASKGDDGKAAATETSKAAEVSGGKTVADTDGKSSNKSAAKPGKTPAGNRKVLGALVALFIPVLAGSLYYWLGSPDIPAKPTVKSTAQAPSGGSAPTASSTAGGQQDGSQFSAATGGKAEEKIAELNKKLEKNPDDLPALIEIARAYRDLRKFQESADAFRRIREISGDHPIVLSSYGEALTMAAGGKVTPEALEVFQKAAEGSPGDQRTRFYLGLAKSQAGDSPGALKIWLDLEADADANAPWLGTLRTSMQQLAEKEGIDLAALRKERPAKAPQSAEPGLSREDMEAARNMTPEQRTQMIRDMVEQLAARLEKNPDDVEGWRRLGLSYKVLGETEKSEEAMAKAAKLSGQKQEPAGEAAQPKSSGQTEGSAMPAPSEEDVKAAKSLTPDQRSEMIRQMVDRLAARLEKNPNDAEGWRRLGLSYKVLGEEEKSKEALAKAAKLEEQKQEPAGDTGTPKSTGGESEKKNEDMKKE